MLIDGSKIVIQQILILFFMIGVGYLASHFALINESGAKQLTDLLLMVITPCVIVSAFQLSFEATLINNMALAGLIAALTHLFGMAVAWLLHRHEKPERRAVLTFSIVFHNVGYFSIPLLTAILGNVGVLYGTVIIAVFNLFSWTYGVGLMNADANTPRWKDFLNPVIIAIVISILLAAFTIRLPGLIQMTLSSLAGLQSPLAMIIIGAQFFNNQASFTVKDTSIWKTVVARDILIPLVLLPVIYFLVKDKTLFYTCVITAAAPTASNCVLFATRFKQNVTLAVQAVMLTTVVSVATIPLAMGLAIWLKGPF